VVLSPHGGVEPTVTSALDYNFYDLASPMKGELMKKTLFVYSVVYYAPLTKEQREAGLPRDAEIVVPPTHVLALNEVEVSLNAARAIETRRAGADEPDRNITDFDILVRPF
jgi:hypothetical protein